MESAERRAAARREMGSVFVGFERDSLLQLLLAGAVVGDAARELIVDAALREIVVKGVLQRLVELVKDGAAVGAVGLAAAEDLVRAGLRARLVQRHALDTQRIGDKGADLVGGAGQGQRRSESCARA